MGTSDDRQSHDGVLVHSDQATGLQHATILLQMLQDGDRFVVREFTVKQRRAFAFREAFLTGATGQQASLLVRAVTEANAQIFEAALPIVLAFGVLAAVVFQVVHGRFPARKDKKY